MRLIIRAIVLLALVWIGLLLSGYGILIGSKENAAVGLPFAKKKYGHY